MAQYHSFKNTGDGNFYLAMESGVAKVHSYESSSGEIWIDVYMTGNDTWITVVGEITSPITANSTTSGDTYSDYVNTAFSNLTFKRYGVTGTQNSKFFNYTSTITPPLGNLNISVAPNTASNSHSMSFGANGLSIEADYPFDGNEVSNQIENTMIFNNKHMATDFGFTTFGSFDVTLSTDPSVIIHYRIYAPPTPTPTPTISNTATPTPSPTSSPLPATPTPTPSRSYENPSIYGVIGATNAYEGLTGTGDSFGFDGGGYTYDWAQIPNKIDGGGYTYLTYDGLVFVIGSVKTRGTTMGALPNFFRPYVSGYPGAKVVSPFPQKRRVWLLGAGVEGGGDVYYYYTYRNTTTGAISTSSSYNLHMDDWCASSTSQTVHASMSQRLHASGGPQAITTRIYRYTLEAIPTGNEIISINFDNNVNGFNTRVVGMGWAQN